MSFRRRAVIFILTIIPVLALDRVTKSAVTACLAGNEPVEAVFGLVRWHYTQNTGIAFSMLEGSTLPVILSCLVILSVLAFAFIERDMTRFRLVSLALIAAGGLGNLYDRLTVGFVTDFIEFTFIDFAVFNIADIAVCCGTFLMIASLLFTGRKA